MIAASDDRIVEALAVLRRPANSTLKEYHQRIAEAIEPIIRERINAALIQYAGSMIRLGVIRKAQAKAWDKGYVSGHSNAMRQMSDEPDAPASVNPYYTEDSND